MSKSGDTSFPRDISKQSKEHRRWSSKAAVCLCLVLVVAACFSSYWRIDSIRADILEQQTSQLTLQKSYYAGKLQEWGRSVRDVAEQVAGADVLRIFVSDAAKPSSQKDSHGNGENDAEEMRSYMVDFLKSFAEAQGMRRLQVVLPDGEYLIGMPGTQHLGDVEKRLLVLAGEKNHLVMGGLVAHGKSLFATLVSPIRSMEAAQEDKPIAYLVAEMHLGGLFASSFLPLPAEGSMHRIDFTAPVRTAEGVRNLSIGRSTAGMPEWKQAGATVQEGVLVRDEEETGPYSIYFAEKEPLSGLLGIHVAPQSIDSIMEKEEHEVIRMLIWGVFVILLALIAYLMWGKAAAERDSAVMERRLGERIRRQKFILDSINGSIQEGMILVDTEGEMQYANPNFWDIAGKRCDEECGECRGNIAGLLPEGIVGDILKGVNAAIAANDETAVEISLGEGASERLFRVSMTPYVPEGRRKGVEVATLVIALFKDITAFRRRAQEQKNRMEQMLQAFASAIECADLSLRGRTKNILGILDLLAGRLTLTPSEMETLKISARMAMLNYLFVPREILNKKAKLTEEEQATVQQSSTIAYQLLRTMNFGLPVAETIYQIGERMNGKGGPNKLPGERILRTGRILAAVNALCSMLKPRGDREPFTPDAAIDEMFRGGGFDPEVMEVIDSLDRETILAVLHQPVEEDEALQASMQQ